MADVWDGGQTPAGVERPRRAVGSDPGPGAARLRRLGSTRRRRCLLGRRWRGFSFQRLLDPLEALGECLAAGVELRASGAKESELHRHARLVTLADGGERCGDRVDRAREAEVRE